ncbi:MAG: hypothetical protein E6704_06890 [Anaerococcus prevotii]|nr:hypothetical protein [Anaerococcus prevotii]
MKYEEIKNDYYENQDICEELEDRIVDGNSEYISDTISEIADSHVDIYNADLLDSLKDLYFDGYYEIVNDEIGLSGDLIKDIQMAQYLRNTDILYDNFDEIVQNAAYRMFIDEGIEIDDDLKSDIDYDLDGVDFNDRIDNIRDEITDYINDTLRDIENNKNKNEERSI